MDVRVTGSPFGTAAWNGMGADYEMGMEMLYG